VPAPAHLGLNLVYLVPGETGGLEVYARELIGALRKVAPDLRLTAFVNREAAAAGPAPWTEAAEPVVVPVNATRRVEWVRGEQQLLPRLAKRAGIDLLHSLASTGPGWGRFVRVTTVHDLIYRLHPEAHFGLRGLGMRVLVPLAARRSGRVITASRATREDIVRLLGIDPGRIDVIPHGVSPPRGVEPVSEATLRERYDLGDRPILFSASAKRPHKNLPRLLDALALLPLERRPVLVLSGYPTPHEAELREHAGALGVASETRFPGWISFEELEGFYAATAAFVFPSLHEGFGLPVLEAMARGAPVACSRTGAVGEVADDAALTFDPTSPRAIADALETLLTDTARADELRRAGRERAAQFTWEATARATLASYERALASGAA
jgi:glycosyltransferase involved in cell wall biosynthesis